MSDWKRRALSGLGGLSLVALPWLVFWPVTIGQQVWAVGDFAAYHHPLFVVTASQWRQGHLPLWNPYLFGGTPLAAAQQAGVFYPLNIPLWLALPAWRVLGLSVLIHLSLTGLGMWLFLRSLQLNPVAVWLGGIVFVWGGFTMSHLGHVGILRALPWVGFALHGINGWLKSGRSRYLLEIGGSVALLCLSGYVQIILYSLIFIATYLLFAIDAPKYRRMIGGLALGLGIGLSAPQILLGVELWISREYLRPGEGDLAALTGYSFHPAYLLTLLFPRGRSGTFAEMVGYVGVIPLLLILLSFLMPRRGLADCPGSFFRFWLVFSLLLSLGRYIPPLALVTFFTPLLGSLGIPSRHLLEFSFSAAVLSAISMDAWMRGVELRKPAGREIRLGIAWILAWTSLALVAPYAPDIPPLHLPLVSVKVVWQPIVLLLSGLALLVLIRLVRSPELRAVTRALLLAHVLWDLLDFGLPIYRPGLTASDFYETPPATVRWLEERGASDAPYRILSFEATGHMLWREQGKNLLAANYNVAYGVESLIGHDGLMLRRLNMASKGKIPSWGWVAPEAVEDPGFRALLDQMNVRYLLIGTGKGEMLGKYYRQVAVAAGVEIYENPRARPRLFVVMPAGNPGAGHLDTMAAFTDASGKLWKDPPAGTRYEVRVLGYSGDQVKAHVIFEGDALLIHSANWVPGWRVWVDGTPASLVQVNGFLQGVYVPAGDHEVRFAYVPDTFWVGMGIGGLSLAVLLALCAGWRLKSRKHV